MMKNRDFNPFDLFRQLEQDIRQHTGSPIPVVIFHPRMDMYETADSLVIKIELAGIQPDKLQIILSADDRTLTISGERFEPSDDHPDRVRCYHLEIFYGAFEREIVLPANLRLNREQIRAHYREGFLTIMLPKIPQGVSEKRTIPINLE